MSETDILEGDLRTASTILEWEFGDIIGHVGVRLPDGAGIAVKLLRVAQEDKDQDWLVHFDFDGNKLSGMGTVPGEAPIYTQIFKARPDVDSIVHAHAPMSIVLGLAGIPVSPVHFQSSRFGGDLPIFPMPSYVSEVADGDALAEALGDAPGITISGHGIVTVGGSIDQACLNAMYMERTAKIQHAAMLVGFRGVSEEFQGMLLENRKKVAERGQSIGRPQTDHSDEWRYYTRKIERGETWNRGWT